MTSQAPPSVQPIAPAAGTSADDPLLRRLADLPPLASGPLDEIRSMEDTSPGLLAEVLEVYLRDSQSHVECAATAAAEGDLDRLRREVHALKSSSGQMGALRLSAVCAEMDRRCRAASLEAARALLPRLLEEQRIACARLTSLES